MNTMRSILVAPLLVSIVALGGADIPPHPDKITFAPLKFEPPDPAQFRHTLSNGVVVFLAPSHEFPLVNIVFTFKGGSYLEPSDKVGLGGATGAMMRRGGAATVSAEAMDERFDFLAANASTSVRGTQSSASLNCLKSNLDESFALFMDMVRNPGFDAKRLDVYKSEVIEGLKQRNDSADSILGREWNRLLYGADHFEASEPTKQAIDSISRDDLSSMHKQIFHPAAGNLYIAVSGDFEEKDMLARLEKAVGSPGTELEFAL